MARFQALTNSILDEELEVLRVHLGLEPSQKAELLREVAAIAIWVVHQAKQGRTIEARQGKQMEVFSHPTLERLRTKNQHPVGKPLVLSGEEFHRLAKVLEQPFKPTQALQRTLSNLVNSGRHPPKIRWK